ncbi:MAG: hypothetical protein ACI8RD_007153, partial [Bacillariaceae sp.]|jgi:hypothetical protein
VVLKIKMPKNTGSDVPESSDLWDLVLDMNWSGCVELAKNQPQDAKFEDGHWHETPLFLASSLSPPVEVIHAIIDAHPESVWVTSRENLDLPIHVACHNQAETTILEELLKLFPETATERTRWGKTPLMALWDSRTKSKIPLDENYWKKVLVILGAVARTLQMDTENDGNIITGLSKDGSPNKALSDDTHIHDTTNDEDDIFFVHGAVSLGQQNCPIEVLLFVMNAYPRQVFQRNKYGHLPLHISTQRVLWSKNKKRRFQPNEQTFISCLLQAYPVGARERIYSDHNRYPLHSAIANGHTWSRGVQDIFLAAPEIVLIRDPSTKLFPFQLSAVPILDGNDNGVDLETVYKLLRSRPDVINYCLQLQRTKKKTDQTTNSTIKRLISSVLVVCIRSAFDMVVGFFWKTCLQIKAVFKSRGRG